MGLHCVPPSVPASGGVGETQTPLSEHVPLQQSALAEHARPSPTHEAEHAKPPSPLGEHTLLQHSSGVRQPAPLPRQFPPPPQTPPSHWPTHRDTPKMVSTQ